MDEAVPGRLTIVADWERLDEGGAEERACFGSFLISADDVSLTEGEDDFVRRLRDGPFVSNYHAAEWFAWNWWRLRWESHSRSADWDLTHRMASIGHGYVWPNVTLFSDGERIVLVARPSSDRRSAFRYIADRATAVRATEFEGALDAYIEQVLAQLDAESVTDTNLHRIWGDLAAERRDPLLSRTRRLEALLGYDPEEAPEDALDGLIAETDKFGEEGVYEFAAHTAMKGVLRTGSDLHEAARSVGFEARPGDAVRLTPGVDLPAMGDVPAWMRGAAAASVLRSQEGLGHAPLSDRRLETIAGVCREAISDRTRVDPDLSFELRTGDISRIVFRSRWATGRRFELARLIGDRVTMPGEHPFKPATRAFTYRQKMQRAFAAEFLCPFDALTDMLKGDYSAEAIEDAAQHFTVSERTVRTLLVNHGRIDREELDWDYDRAAA